MGRARIVLSLGTAALIAVVVLPVTSTAQQGQPPIGIAPVAVGAGPYVFDTAEQHKIRVVVVASGLNQISVASGGAAIAASAIHRELGLAA